MAFKSGFNYLKSSLYRTLPKSFSSRLDAYRNRLIYDKSKLLFFHIPRSAGTSVATSLYGKSILHVKASQYQKMFPKHFDECTTFSIFRDPVDRFLSSFKFIKSAGSKHLDIDYQELYSTKVFSTPSTFLRFLVDNPDKIYIDNVFHPQCDFIISNEGNLLVDHVFHFSNLSEVEDFIRRQKTNFCLPLSNSSSYKFSSTSLSCEDHACLNYLYKADFNFFHSIKC